MKEWRFAIEQARPLVQQDELVGIGQNHFENMSLAIVEIQLH